MKKFSIILWLVLIALISLTGQFADPYFKSLIMEILIWALFAMSFNILYGYTGLLSFGQSLFFGIGCYSFALSIIHWDFSILTAIIFSIAVSFLVALITGILIIRVVSHYFVILTVLFSLIPFYLANRLSWLTGGDDGLPVTLPESFIEGFNFSTYNANNMYWVVSFTCLSVLFVCMRFLNSPVALILKGVRENELKMEFMGYDPKKYRYLSWLIAGTLAGLAGGLYVLAFKYTSSLYFHWTLSGEAVIWTIAGGKGTFLGPIIGTASLIYIKDELSTAFEFYPMIVAFLLVVLVHFKPSGIVGIISTIFSRFWTKSAEDPPIKLNLSEQYSINNIPFDSKSILKADSLGKSFDGVQAVKDINFEINIEEIKVKYSYTSDKIVDDQKDEWLFVKNEKRTFPCLAFIGPNGAGKTTLFNLLSGAYSKVDGQATLFDKNIFKRNKLLSNSKLQLSKYKIVYLGLTRTFQQAQLFTNITVEENLLIAIQFRINPWSVLPKRKQMLLRRRRMEEILTKTNLIEERKKLVKELSYGRQKMLEIGLAIALGGKVLMLDEPTAGVSPHEINLILSLILNLSKSHSILVIEHDLEVVKKLGFITIVMADGEIIAAGLPNKILSLSHVREKFYGE